MPASPLHASFPENRHSAQSQDGGRHSPSQFTSSPKSPRAGGPASRQTRRLQLRNAGFRGPNINTTRTTTPPSASLPSMINSTNPGGATQSSDAENVSPSGRRAGDDVGGQRKDSSGGVLQDIGNSATLRNSRRVRGRVTSKQFWSADSTNKRESRPSDDLQSPPPTTTSGTLSGSIRQRSVRTRAKMPRTQRSTSAETRKYVEHLEAQLSEAQSQLSAMNSPTITREQSSKMRHLNAETRQLQEEVAAWEDRYEERVQEELDKHYEFESTLRTRVRSLEQELEERQFRISELEMQVEHASQAIEVAETANVNLEKRLEILSELLAMSPTKIDLHAETPGRARQGRPQSMIIPRFPTVSSLATSPELRSVAQTSPMSPTLSVARLSSPRPMGSPTDMTFSPEVASSDDEESVHSDMNSVICVPPPNQKPRPTRRMRRFGAGSIGPKPLILPSTSHCEQIPFSAPPLEPKEGESVFPFPPRIEEEATGSPAVNRRRASSEAVQQQAVQPSTSTIMSFASVDGDDAGRRTSVLRLSPPHSRLSLTRDFDSMDSRLHATSGRNLMEELTAAETSGSDSGEELPADTKLGERDEDGIPNSSPFNSDAEDERPPPHYISKTSNEEALPTSPAGSGQISDASSALAAPSIPKTVIHRRASSNGKSHSRSSSRSSINTAQSKISLSSIDSLRSILSNMFRSPVELAKHLVQTAQTRMSIPRPLLSVQWWLVGILLGPMARRRMLGRSTKCCDNKPKSPDKQPLIEDTSPTKSDPDPLAYRTAYQTPESADPSPVRARSLVAGKGKKRAASSESKTPSSPCEHQLAIQKRWKHSPFLWLKFSMTLAIAVGVAFKDGPSSLLKEAVCRCKAQEEGKRRGGGGHGRKLSVGSWKRKMDDGVLVTPGS